MDLKKVHSIVNQFQRNIFKNSSFIDNGFFASSFKGAGLQFKEHQIYTFGDELRFIDWKLLAKKNMPYIKTFEEERNIEVNVIVDCQPNLVLSHDGKCKFVNILEMLAILILFAGKTKDTVSLYLVGKKPLVIKKLAGENGLLKLITYLTKIGLFKEKGDPNIESIYDFCQDEFIKDSYRPLYSMKKGPFVIFSPFENGQYDFFRKMYSNKNTHFFKLQCPFEKERSMLRYKTAGIGFISKSLDHENRESKNRKINYLEIDKTPLVGFVEGIMSNETRV